MAIVLLRLVITYIHCKQLLHAGGVGRVRPAVLLDDVSLRRQAALDVEHLPEELRRFVAVSSRAEILARLDCQLGPVLYRLRDVYRPCPTQVRAQGSPRGNRGARSMMGWVSTEAPLIERQISKSGATYIVLIKEFLSVLSSVCVYLID